jgi:hypothetical protein
MKTSCSENPTNCLIGYRGKTYAVGLKRLESGKTILTIAGIEEGAWPIDMVALAYTRAESAGLI